MIMVKEVKVEQRSGAFALGMLASVVEESRNARAMLRNHEYSSEEERLALMETVKHAKPFEEMLKNAKEKGGL